MQAFLAKRDPNWNTARSRATGAHGAHRQAHRRETESGSRQRTLTSDSPVRSDGGGRRAEILTAAVDRFGRQGYENTSRRHRRDVGIGATRCTTTSTPNSTLYVNLEQALKDVQERRRDHLDPRGPAGGVARRARRCVRAVRERCAPQPRARRRAGTPEPTRPLPPRRGSAPGGPGGDTRAGARLDPAPDGCDATGGDPRARSAMLTRRSSASTTASGTGSGPTIRWACRRSPVFVDQMLAVAGVYP